MAEAGHFSVPDRFIIEFCVNEYEGVKFLPSDDQIFRFLRAKNRDPNDSSVHFIMEIDLLNHEPWELRRLSALGHYFCKSERYGNGKCRKRSTKLENGYWEQGGKAKTIHGSVVRRTLRFYKYVYEYDHEKKKEMKKAKRTGYMIYEYEPTDFDFEKNPFVMIRLEECEAGSGELLASNAVNSLTENTLPQLPNAFEGELTVVKSETEAGSGALPPIASNRVNIDDMPISQLNTYVQSIANPTAPLSGINFCVPIGGVDAMLTDNTNAIDFCNSVGGVDVKHTGNTNTNDAYELSVPLSLHFPVPVVEGSSEDNYNLVSDQVPLSWHLASIFDPGVADALGSQVDRGLLVESEPQAGGGALPPPVDQEYTGNSYTNEDYEWADRQINFGEY